MALGIFDNEQNNGLQQLEVDVGMLNTLKNWANVKPHHSKIQYPNSHNTSSYTVTISTVRNKLLIRSFIRTLSVHDILLFHTFLHTFYPDPKVSNSTDCGAKVYFSREENPEN